MILFLSYLVKNGIFRVSVISKLAKRWYVMRMCTSWLCPFKTGNNDSPCLRSFCYYRNDFNFPVSLWAVLKNISNKAASINGHKIRRRGQCLYLRRDTEWHTQLRLFSSSCSVSRESFKNMIKYTLQTVANQFLISIYFMPCTLNKQLQWPLRSGGHMLCRYVTLPRFHITRVTLYLRTFAQNFSSR